MDTQTPHAHVCRFGVFELDINSGELRRHGLKIRLPEQCFQILRALLDRPGEVVTRDHLRQLLWTSNTFVDFEVGLNSAVRKLRAALDDSAENPQFIETLPRRGYRFVASVSRSEPITAPASAPGFNLHVELAHEQPAEAVPSPALTTAAPGRRRAWQAAGSLATAVLILAGGVLYNKRGGGPTTEPNSSLVVLPFENLTGDPGQEYFVDSLTDGVSAHLADVPQLDVISRTSARQYN